MNSELLRDAFRYMYPKELPYFKELIQGINKKDPVIINIGAGAGTSGLAALESREDAIVHTIDVTDEPNPLGCLSGERLVVGQAGLDHLADVRWFQHHGDSKAIGRKWMIKVDMVYIDGDHTYEGCRGDIEAWLPHLRTGGLIVIHDYGKQDLPVNEFGPHPKVLMEIDRAVDELLTGKYKKRGRVDSMVVFENERIEKPIRKQRQPRTPARLVGVQKPTKVSD